jgi:DNA-binding beta-propeller fold protein YncE
MPLSRFACLLFCAGFALSLEGREAPKITGAISPDGSYALVAEMTTEAACTVEIKARPGRAQGKFSVSNLDTEDRHSGISAIWSADSSAVAVNVHHGSANSECRVFVLDRKSWRELPWPAWPGEGVHRPGNGAGNNPANALTFETWLPEEKMKLAVTGNEPGSHAVIFRLARTGKPHLEYLQTILSKAGLDSGAKTNELPCTFRVLSGGNDGGGEGPASAATFAGPSGLAVDSTGNILVADRVTQTLHRVSQSGTIESVAGAPGERGSADGAGKAARFWDPQALALDRAGNIYVAETGAKRIRKVSLKGNVTTVATGFKYPAGLASDHEGNIYVADAIHCVIQKIARDESVSVLAGKPGEPGTKNGRGEEARFRFPSGVAVAPNGVIYVLDHQAIRKIDPKGNVTTFAGSLEEQGRSDGTGANARFWGLTSIAIDAKGNLYVTDHDLRNVRCITPNGAVQTLRGPNHSDVPLQNPMAIAVDAHGKVYVADQNAGAILVLEPNTDRR